MALLSCMGGGDFCGSSFSLWYNKISAEMNIELLSWFGNFLNFLIFAYLAINVVNTMCFNSFQMGLSLIGLLASIFVQIVSASLKID